MSLGLRELVQKVRSLGALLGSYRLIVRSAQPVVWSALMVAGFSAAVYAQSAPPIFCLEQPRVGAGDSGGLDHAASQSVSPVRYRPFQYSLLTGAPHAGSYNREDQPHLDRLWHSPFSSYPEDSTDRDGSADADGTPSPLELGGVSLWAQKQQTPPQPPKQPSAEQGSPKHIFGIVPAFEVSYLKHFKPLTPREKFEEWARGTYDPGGLGLYAAEAATLEHSSSDGFCDYGKGWGGYGKCLGSMELDANISSFFGDFLFPVIMHQDPRFFRLGKGPAAKRVLYAVSRVFITHADSGRNVLFTSALSGSVVGAAASNLYYPRQDRGFSHSLNRFGIDLADTAAFNVSAEFWPEIKGELKRVF